MRAWRKWQMIGLALVGGATLARPAGAGAEQPAVEQIALEGRVAVVEVLGEWTDNSRNRAIPYKIYRPAEIDRPAPVVLFSHGLGGNRNGAGYLNSYLASHGFIVIALQHPGSDSSLIEEERLTPQTAREMLVRGANMRTAQDRYRDVGFAIDSLKTMNTSGPLAGKLDLSRIGMSGHSFGAVTTLVAAGQRVGRGGDLSFRDKRIKAAITYSPNKPALGDPAAMLADVKIPILHMTGTRDGSVLDRGVTVEDRKVPFHLIKGAPQYLIVLTEGDHMVFSGRRLERGRPAPTDAAHVDIIKAASLAFWNAFLVGDGNARTWLDNELPRAVGSKASVSHRF